MGFLVVGIFERFFDNKVTGNIKINNQKLRKDFCFVTIKKKEATRKPDTLIKYVLNS